MGFGPKFAKNTERIPDSILSRRRRTYVEELVRYLGRKIMMSAVTDGSLCSVGKWCRYMCKHRIFLRFDLCHAIVPLRSIPKRLTAAQTPTWVGLGAEEADMAHGNERGRTVLYVFM